MRIVVQTRNHAGHWCGDTRTYWLGHRPNEEGFINCCFSFNFRRDTWDIPLVTVGNFWRTHICTSGRGDPHAPNESYELVEISV
ncbi:hypothetical protein BJY52DRAFT_1267038 [Lactarius psammicola]|nr:hypothetical protein BJY52DRAFT_1267038 [Lactarius psammicola]